jgi:glutamate-5-semialdehyde dehydrogenase
MSISPHDASTLTDTLARAGAAARELARARSDEKDDALAAMAAALEARTERLLAANRVDVGAARRAGLPPAVVIRLTLTPERVAAMAAGVRKIIALPDPVGDVAAGWRVPNGLRIRKVRVPLGVIGVIYEGRPNVTVDAAALCLKAGNASLLRGSSTAAATNLALVEVMRDAIAPTAVAVDSVQLVDASSRETVEHMLQARGAIDLLVPRGGAALIDYVTANSRVPVVETGVGNCHVYVDASADPGQAAAVTVNAKTFRPSVCNAAETLLVHREIAPTFLPEVVGRLRDAGVELVGDEAARQVVALDPATEQDFATEFLDLRLAIAVVPDFDAALAHIARYGTRHTETILTRDRELALRFQDEVDAAVVMVNAPTAFTDGEEFGFGAEVGISTQKLHARGPMGLPELTCFKYLVDGSGQLRR